MFLASTSLISAVCCQKLSQAEGGQWCQDAESSSQCDSYYDVASATNCEETPYCAKGTCKYSEEGTCTSGTSYSVCEIRDGETWVNLLKSEIDECKMGCCIYMADSAPLNYLECKDLGIDSGFTWNEEITFNSQITDEASCEALSLNPNDYGACVINLEFERDCYMTTRGACTSNKFHKGDLCTNSKLETDCAKTENTRCEKDYVYYEDSCGNLANIYNSDRYDDLNYWETIQEPDCTIEEDGPESCGNCNYINGTMCKEYDSENLLHEYPANQGDNICASLDCMYDTDGDSTLEKYQHGETWCAETPGTAWHLAVYPETNEFTNTSLARLADVYNVNLPGSEYILLSCVDGEVMEEACGSMRNEYCVEVRDDDYSISSDSPLNPEDIRYYIDSRQINNAASESFKEGIKEDTPLIANCTKNDWTKCIDITSKTECENSNVDCKWIYGYRIDGENVNSKKDRNSDKQGMCLPLIAPGLTFWGENAEDAVEQCSIADVSEVVKYKAQAELDDFAGHGLTRTANACQTNCYIIPKYGSNAKLENPPSGYGGNTMEAKIKAMEMLWKGYHFVDRLPNYRVSLRKEHYCINKDNREENDNMRCAEEESNRNKFPVFFTHDEWLYTTKIVSNSLGDCGYKLNNFVQSPSEKREIVTVVSIFHGEIEIYVDNEIYVGEENGYR